MIEISQFVLENHQLIKESRQLAIQTLMNLKIDNEPFVKEKANELIIKLKVN